MSQQSTNTTLENKPYSIMVTGATGFIGTRLISHLSKLGYSNNLGVRILNDRFTCLSAIYSDDFEKIGIFCGGFTNNGNAMSPDGSLSDGYWKIHKWMFIPIRKNKSIILSNSIFGNIDSGYISGISFGKNNLWSFTVNSAYAFEKAVNGGDSNNHYNNFKYDQSSSFSPKKSYTIYVPIIPNGKDKIIFFIGDGDHKDQNCFTSIFVNDKPIERIRQTYVNPISYFYNSVMYSQYFGAFIPKEIIKENENFIKVSLSFENQDYVFYMRHAGTHDYY